MENIYNFLKSAWQEIINESKNNFSFIFATLYITTIPLSLGINNFCLILLLFSFILKGRKTMYNFSRVLIYPILLFLVMALSYSWSIDKLETLKAIPKAIVLLLLPIFFLFFNSFSIQQINKLKKYYSYSMFLYVVYFLIKACIRYLIAHDIRVFFYHGDYSDDFGLVPKNLNAIHVSVFVGLGYFYFLIKEFKSKLDWCIILIFFVFIILLSSKNIIIIFLLLNSIYYFFYSKEANKMRIRNLILAFFAIGTLLFYSKIKERFLFEFQTNSNKSISHNVINGLPESVHNISIIEAWNNEKFSPNDFFPGTAFRVYQARLFFELLNEEDIFFQGFGLNASYVKLEEKGKHYNVFLGNKTQEGYQKKNFHNQYIQVFAELGFIGFLLLLIILFVNLKKAFMSKDFMHIAFAILMISLFLTESFLWRQRGVVFFTLFYCLFNLKTVETK